MPESESKLLEATAIGGDTQAIIDAARAGVEPKMLDPEAVYALPVPAPIVDLEQFRDRPDAQRGNFFPSTVDSFVQYVKEQETAGETTIWVQPDGGHIEAILNDHHALAPGWGDHKAILDLIVSPEWRFWLAQDGELLSQQEFAEHIEEGIADMVSPDGAQMLEIAQSIEGKNDVAFKSKIDLTSGEVRLGYEEKVEAQAGTSGQLAVPREFTIGVAPFIGEDAFKLNARLRWRVNGGKLMLGYKLDRPDAAVREVLAGIYKRLTDTTDGFSRVFYGKPPSGSRKRVLT